MTNASNQVTALTGVFTSADIGKFITGTDIPAGTTITGVSVASPSDTLTLSKPLSSPAGATVSDVAVINNAALPVPEGAYNLTYVSNGNLGASLSDSTYIQSVISSAATFTVAPF
jgi:hypothetical protein